MYGKLFAQMYDGTLGTKGPWQALVAFQQMVILADKHGNVDMTAEALSRRTTIPLEIIHKGIKTLMEPDPESRSPDEDGRRIVPIDHERSWGWRIVNYEHYRKIRSEEERREYHRQYMRRRRSGDTGANLDKVTFREKINRIAMKALSDGRISRGPCEVCGETYKELEMHHDDYSKPLCIRWLCAKHHKQWHRENGEGIYPVNLFVNTSTGGEHCSPIAVGSTQYAVRSKQEAVSSKQEEKPSSGKPDYPPGFCRFWAIWPKTERKQGKSDCLKIWQKKKLEEKVDVIVAHVEFMATSESWMTGYDPMPATYLNKERWEGAEIAVNRTSLQPGAAAYLAQFENTEKEIDGEKL